MINGGVQRTLVIGLGPAGARVADRVLAHLVGTLGPVGIAEGIGVGATEDEEPELALVDSTLRVSPRDSFHTWQADLEAVVAGGLRHISHLEHLTALAARGLTLRHTAEVHLMLVADLGRPWAARSLAAVADCVHDVVYHTLACDSALTGLLLFAGTRERRGEEHPQLTDSAQTNVSTSQPSNLPPTDSAVSDEVLENLSRESLNLFNRGCFIASLTNESGLVVGDVDDLVRRASHFLALLATSPLGAAAVETGWDSASAGDWGAPASFGLATARWPGQELSEALSGRWAERMLAWLAAPVPGVEEAAGAAAQSLVASQRLAPPLLVEQLAELMPGIPGHLADEVPDPPWPWQLADVQRRLEALARGWEEAWLAARGTLKPCLAEIGQAWQATARDWLAGQNGKTSAGTLTRSAARLTALGGLLEAFVDGVEAQVEEAEADLAAIERRLSSAAASLASQVAAFPPSPLETMLRWSLRPLGWLRRWAQCRSAQAAARSYAHLLRTRFAALQALWLYEAALPCYRAWLADWREESAAWESCADQVARARGLPQLARWHRQLERVLAGAGGPWSLEMVEGLYQSVQETQELAPEMAWEQLGPLGEWAQDGLDAGEMAQRLRQHAARALVPGLELPVDRALMRQIPEQEGQEAWLAAFIARSSPFLRYDEAALSEAARSQVRREVWLLLPGGDASPLAPACRAWSAPPTLLRSQHPHEMIAVVVRRGISLPAPGAPPKMARTFDG
jgi:hypothetical protein